MTALAAARNTPQMGDTPIAKSLSLPVAAAKKIYQGSLVMPDVAGRATPAAAITTADQVCAGVAAETVDNSSGAAGALPVPLKTGIFRLANSAGTDALTIADRHRLCFAADDQTVSRTSNSGRRAIAGRVVDVDSDGVWVEVGVSAPSTASGLDIHLVAAADLSAKTGFLVKVDAAGKAALAAAGEAAIGVLVNAPVADAIAIVRTAGIGLVIAAGVHAKGAVLAADANGKAVAATTGKVNTSDAGAAADPLIASHVIGVSLETGAADTLTACLILPMGAVPTTAA